MRSLLLLLASSGSVLAGIPCCSSCSDNKPSGGLSSGVQWPQAALTAQNVGVSNFATGGTTTGIVEAALPTSGGNPGPLVIGKNGIIYTCTTSGYVMAYKLENDILTMVSNEPTHAVDYTGALTGTNQRIGNCASGTPAITDDGKFIVVGGQNSDVRSLCHIWGLGGRLGNGRLGNRAGVWASFGLGVGLDRGCFCRKRCPPLRRITSPPGQRLLAHRCNTSPCCRHSSTSSPLTLPAGRSPSMLPLTPALASARAQTRRLAISAIAS